MKLPTAYAWLARDPGPRILREALGTHGVRETAGARNTPEIMAWAKEVRFERDYTADSIPWCGLWMSVIAKRAD